MSLVRTNWNVVARLEPGCFATGKWHLDRVGGLPGETDDPELLVATVPDVDRWLARLLDKWRVGWSMFDDFRYIRPVRKKVAFDSEAEFYDRAGALALDFASRIAGKRVAIHAEARGFERTDPGGRICRILRRVLTDRLDVTCEQEIGALGGGDVVIDLEIVGGTAGIAVWSTEERERFPFLGLTDGSRRSGPQPTRPVRM